MKVYQVGGAVRDKLLGVPSKDIDYVVVGATVQEMLSLGYVQVGKNFPVFINPKTKAEYALARKEIKIGKKHTDFEFIFGAEITLKEDLQRRDFTCNALAYDEATKELFDYNGGIVDIENKTLRHINSTHFVEDPLRVLRMCRFAAQLNFAVDPETLKLTQKMVEEKMLENLSTERVWKEVEKALKCKNFEKFIEVSKDCGAFDFVFPELSKKQLFSFKNTENLSAKAKFSLLISACTSREDVMKICNRLKIPNEYKNFALKIFFYHNKLDMVASASVEELVDFVIEFTKAKSFDALEELLKIYKIIEEDKNKPYEIGIKLKTYFDILSKLKASDMPNFDVLKNSKEINMLYKNFRINTVLNKIKK